jgi:NAD(P)-dependent dehydrogenase (short-subunit alcohol dehydrogenase family)
MNLFSLDGKISFVTGSGSGIGQRLAIGLAEAGASVGCFDLPSSRGLEYTVDRIRQLGRSAIALTGDVTRFSDLNEAIDVVEKQLGPLLSPSTPPVSPIRHPLRTCRLLNGSECSTSISRASFSHVKQRRG